MKRLLIFLVLSCLIQSCYTYSCPTYSSAPKSKEYNDHNTTDKELIMAKRSQKNEKPSHRSGR